MSDIPADLVTITAATLTPMVRGALRQDRADIVDWRHEAYGHSLDEVYGLPRSVIRFSGTARDRGRSIPWALVLKIVATSGTPDDPSLPDNGDREPLAYQSGFLDGLSGLRAPRCFGVQKRPAGDYWLWLEDIVDNIGREWPVQRYTQAARHLGRFNAAHLAEHSGFSHAWLSRSPLRDAVRQVSPGVQRLPEALGNAFVAQAVSPSSAAALAVLLQESEALLDVLDLMPQSICHWDAHRANLFSRMTTEGEEETVAIDWAGVGWGPLGSELSKLLSQTVNFFGLDPRTLSALDAELFERYLEGLRETGWQGDRRAVRFGYTAASAMRLIVRVASALRLAADDQAPRIFRASGGAPIRVVGREF